MRKISFFIGALLLPFLGSAQRISDSVTVYIDNRVEMCIVVDDFHDLKSNSNIPTMLSKFQTVLTALQGRLDPNMGELIKYSMDSIATVEEGSNASVYLIDGDKISNTGGRDKAILKTKTARIILITKDITQLSENALISCVNKVFQLLPEKSSVAQSLFYQCIGDAVTEITSKHRSNSYGDAIELTFGAGAGILKNSWMGDFTFAASVRLNKKGFLRHNPYVSANLLYHFPGDGKMHINTFLNLGYRWNRSEENEEASMFGVEFGYLISREGDFFHKNTFRFGLNTDLTRGISISPQVYMEDNFSRMYPGIRIGFGL